MGSEKPFRENKQLFGEVIFGNMQFSVSAVRSAGYCPVHSPEAPQKKGNSTYSGGNSAHIDK